ncbi:MAG: YaiI/YqxD family protein [Emcibacter sp.]|nr:YaiI/YqxD family protein [Emcibacter sp.]
MADNEKISIYVDADACPVKEEILKVSYRHGLRVYIVSNQWLRLEVGPLVQKIVVPDGPDVADDWIAEHVKKHDIAVTADILLAKRCLDAEATVLGPTGKPFSEDNIGMAVAMRDLKAHLRETGESKGYNPSFTKTDKSRFLQALESAIQRRLKEVVLFGWTGLRRC